MSYIKNFTNWNLINEEEIKFMQNQSNLINPASTEQSTQAAPAQPSAAAAPAPASPKVEAITLNSPDGKLLAADIIKIQRKLISLGLLAEKQPSGNSSADGRVGPATSAAIQAFRAKFGLVPANAAVTQYSIGPKTYAKFVELFASDKAASDKAAADKAASDKAAADKAAADKAAADKASADKTKAAGQPAKAQGSESEKDLIVVPPPGSEAEAAASKQAKASQESPFVRTKADDSAAIKVADSVLAKFSDKAFWKPFKGAFNDNEKEAGEAFNRWAQDNIMTDLITLRKGDENKDIISNAIANIVKKLRGGQVKDKLTFKIKTSLGDRTYTVNTDF
jgi:peptidoglycan hydrolase-like protein with peptidoglycan-binding domain